MGWYGFYTCKNVKDVVEMLNRDRRASTLVAQKATNFGRHLWSVYTIQTGPQAGRNIITLDLISQYEGMWGYKPMDESMGPFYYDCPVALLELAGEPVNESAAQWRKSVRELVAKKARKLEAGTTFTLYGKAYRMVNAAQRIVSRIDDGTLFKLKRTQVADVVVTA